MNTDNSAKNATNYTLSTWLAVAGVALATMLVVVGWGLRIAWPNIENLDTDLLIPLTIGVIIWTLGLLGLYERLTLSAQTLAQKRIRSRSTYIDLAQLISVVPTPMSSKGSRRPYKLILKDIHGAQMELFGDKFPRKRFQPILHAVRAAIASQQVVAEEHREDVERILMTWDGKSSAWRALMVPVKYITTGCAITLIATTLNSEVNTAITMHNGCGQIRSAKDVTTARVQKTALTYESTGGRYSMREYPTDDINKATTLYLTVATHVAGKEYTHTIRAHSGSKEDRVSLYNKANRGTIEVYYSPTNPAFVVLAHTTHKDFRICNDI